MSKVILDEEWKAKFPKLDEPIELCDANGQTLGRYVPEDVYQKIIYQLAEAQCPSLNAEEIFRRRHKTDHKSLAEILQKLRAS